MIEIGETGGYEIFFEDAEKYLDENEFEKAYSSLTDYRKKRVNQCKREEVKRLSLATGHLMVRVLRKYGVDPEKVSVGEFGKPFLPGGELYFSLANENTQAVMAVSKRDIGCDLERVTMSRYSQLMVDKKYLPGEKKYINSLPFEKRLLPFFRVWTQKEAYGKLLGTGIEDAILLDTVIIHNGSFEMGSRFFNMSEYPHPDQNYIISVCQYA
ncbi:MAG: 4'-phosphopantetheinyl transferase superfamily protein [Lachnospiraceae bacterium]|nr:4'-phosphopantetheinyl transferase superfamily protein [Lachnospiraceae bacterium]